MAEKYKHRVTEVVNGQLTKLWFFLASKEDCRGALDGYEPTSLYPGRKLSKSYYADFWERFRVGAYWRQLMGSWRTALKMEVKWLHMCLLL